MKLNVKFMQIIHKFVEYCDFICDNKVIMFIKQKQLYYSFG